MAENGHLRLLESVYNAVLVPAGPLARLPKFHFGNSGIKLRKSNPLFRQPILPGILWRSGKGRLESQGEDIAHHGAQVRQF